MVPGQQTRYSIPPMNLNLTIDPSIDQAAFFGHADRNLKLLRELLDVHLSARDETLRLSGEPAAVSRAAAVLAELQRYLRHHSHVDRDQLVAIVRRTESEIAHDATAAGPDDAGAIDVSARGQLIRAKTDGQKRYLHAITQNDLVFCDGPAGTGKTFLAVAMAVSLLRRSIIRRIVLVPPSRPAKNSASSPAASKKRSTPTSAHCSTPSPT
jgi:phosphate starvation-inducible PhoH-like protein